VGNEHTNQFDGFHEDNLDLIRVPESFFTQLLPNINKLTHVRLLLYMFWHLEQQQGNVRYFRFKDLAADPMLIEMLKDEETLKLALAGLVNLNAVLEANLDWMDETYYFINGPQGRAAIEAIEKGQWKETLSERVPIHMTAEPANIFQLYEENIGLITPIMAEILKEDEAEYPPLWIEEAIKIAVTGNKRNWKYIQAILERWQKEGRGNEQNRRDRTQDPDIFRKKWLGE
jgi:DNA replication protein